MKYKIIDLCSPCGIIFSYENILPFVLDLNHSSKNILNIKQDADNYYFLFPEFCCSFFTTKINYQMQEVLISVSNSIKITIAGELICEKNVENLKYSYFEIVGGLCLIYFTGKKDYIVIIKNKELCYADFYDECNVSEKEKYFMTKLNDGLNHGRVCHIKDKEVENYLVYLDDEDLCLKSEFIPCIFLDCLKAKNINYCKFLLSEEFSQVDFIEKFFPEFDYFYPLNFNKFVLINKNTLAGIYEFKIDNNKISNIMCC